LGAVVTNCRTLNDLKLAIVGFRKQGPRWHHMRRREFTALIGGAAAFPLVARAQRNREPRKVGILFPGVLGTERVRFFTEGLTSEPGSEKAILVVRSAEGKTNCLASTRANWRLR